MSANPKTDADREREAVEYSRKAWNTVRPRAIPAPAPAHNSIYAIAGHSATTPKRSTEVGR